MVSRLDIQRKFDMLLPGIARKERQFTNDLLAGGENYAQHNRRMTEASHDTGEELKGALLVGRFIYDFENMTETYVPVQPAEQEERLEE